MARRFLSLFIPSSLVVAAALAACSSTGPAPEAHEAATKQPIKDIAWKDMSKQERGSYMKDVVMPAMKPLFVAFDAKYADMNCTTCHGKAAVEDHSFKMPNPEILPLPTTHEGFEKLGAEKGAMMKFMGEQVKPKMAELLGLPQWEPTRQDGFGCYACHTMQAAQ